MKQPHIYKFLHTQHLDSVLAGNVRISSVSVFREMERHGEAAWIADRLENVSEVNFKGPIYPSEALAQSVPPGRRPLVAAPPGLQILMQNVSIQYGGPDVFIYSASRGNLRRLSKIMCDDVSDRRNACVEILNFTKLADILFEHGRTIVNEKTFPVRDLFQSVEQGPVRYQNMSVSAGMSMTVASAFIKDIAFISQSEVRIALTPRDNPIPNILNVTIDRPDRFFQEVFRGR